jgi:hypothetical protein
MAASQGLLSLRLSAIGRREDPNAAQRVAQRVSRHFVGVASVLWDVDSVLNAAVMKQVPTSEYFLDEVVRTLVFCL